MAAFKITFGLCLGLMAAATAQAGVLHESFMPENNLNLQDCLACESTAGLNESQFMAVIAKAQDIFGPIVAAQGGTLVINPRWTDSTVNANATQMGDSWVVNMYGGLARRPEITVDGFTMVLCHEIGHHLAGFPFVSAWAADEGQADYFAAHVCPALWWGADSNDGAVADVPDSVTNRCSTYWQSSADAATCDRAALAAKSVVGLLAVLKHQTIDFDGHDAHEVTATYHGHPDAQCRLDTYLAAAACPLAWNTGLIPGKSSGTGDNTLTGEQDSANYVCTMSGDYPLAQRPHCWFKPNL